MRNGSHHIYSTRLCAGASVPSVLCWTRMKRWERLCNECTFVNQFHHFSTHTPPFTHTHSNILFILSYFFIGKIVICNSFNSFRLILLRLVCSCLLPLPRAMATLLTMLQSFGDGSAVGNLMNWPNSRRKSMRY